jgi:hypothetical protein
MQERLIISILVINLNRLLLLINRDKGENPRNSPFPTLLVHLLDINRHTDFQSDNPYLND